MVSQVNNTTPENTMTAQEKILDRIKKLFALADSANVNEAGNAAAQAQRLMAKHAIDAAMLETAADEDEQAGEEVLYDNTWKVLPTWRQLLAQDLAKANRCRSFQRGRNLCIVGRPSDCANVRYMHAYLMTEVDRLTKSASKDGGGLGRTWMNNFRLGAVTEVGRRVQIAALEARQEAKAEAVAQTDGGASLARIDSALATLDGHAKAVDDYIARNLNVRSSSASYTGNQDARQAGTRAGANINIGGAAGQIGRGHAALGRG